MANERTILHLYPGDYGRLQAIARHEGRAVSELIRDAVNEYLDGRRSGRAKRSSDVRRANSRDWRNG